MPPPKRRPLRPRRPSKQAFAAHPPHPFTSSTTCPGLIARCPALIAPRQRNPSGRPDMAGLFQPLRLFLVRETSGALVHFASRRAVLSPAARVGGIAFCGAGIDDDPQFRRQYFPGIIPRTIALRGVCPRPRSTTIKSRIAARGSRGSALPRHRPPVATALGRRERGGLARSALGKSRQSREHASTTADAGAPDEDCRRQPARVQPLGSGKLK